MRYARHDRIKTLVIVLGILALGAAQSLAQEPTAEELARANNPLADIKALNMQFN